MDNHFQNDLGGVLSRISTSLNQNTESQSKREHLRRKRTQKQQEYRELVKANIPPLYRRARLAHIPPKLRAALLSKRGLYLWGSVGSGKTYSFYALSRLYCCTKIGDQVIVQAMTVVSFDSILRELRDGMSRNCGNYSEATILRKYQNRSYLVIDDLAAGSDSGFSERVLLSLIDTRLNNMLPTSFTSNLPPEKIKSLYGERVFSRIMAMCDVVRMGGEDKRLSRHKKG